MSYLINPYILSTTAGIDTNGLTLDLNARNYPGSGTSWVDSAQNLTFSSTGTISYGNVAGVPAFNFNGSNYWTYATNPSLVDLGGDFTLAMWIYPQSLAERRTIFEKAGTSYQSYQQELAITWEVGNIFTYYSRRSPAYDSAATGTFTNSAWQLISIKVSTGKTTSPRTGFWSINGSSWTSNYVSNSNNIVDTSGEIRVGTGYAGTVTTGSIGRVITYNKMLSDAEILSLYNTTRSLFGV